MKKIFLLVALAAVMTGCAGKESVNLGVLSDLAGGRTVYAATRSDDEPEILGSCVTEFNVKSKGRAHNIALGAERLDGRVVEPGAVFSFNDTVGPTGKSYGFWRARIFVRGKDEKGYGGGICQVSSTLYSAVLAAGLPVVERHGHSKKVSYVPEGHDAATSYGVIDFKFKNDLDFPITIRSGVYEGKLAVALEVSR